MFMQVVSSSIALLSHTTTFFDCSHSSHAWEKLTKGILQRRYTTNQHSCHFYNCEQEDRFHRALLYLLNLNHVIDQIPSRSSIYSFGINKNHEKKLSAKQQGSCCKEEKKLSRFHHSMESLIQIHTQNGKRRKIQSLTAIGEQHRSKFNQQQLAYVDMHLTRGIILLTLGEDMERKKFLHRMR